jgi:hypothetical protein
VKVAAARVKVVVPCRVDAEAAMAAAAATVAATAPLSEEKQEGDATVDATAAVC